MSLYVKVIEGNVLKAPGPCPRILKLDDNSVITNFDKMPDSEKIKYGYYEYIDNTPSIHPDYQIRGTVSVVIEGTQVIVRHEVINIPLEDYISKRVEEVYEYAKRLLDNQAKNRSIIETSSWHFLKYDIKQYVIDGSIGQTLQTAVDRSNHSVQSLVDSFYPKIDFEDEVIKVRSRHVLALQSKTSHEEVRDYNIYLTEGDTDFDGNPIDTTDMIAWPRSS